MAIYHPVGAKHFRIQCSLLRWVKNNVPNRSVQTYYSKDPPFTDPNLPSHFLISAYLLQKRTQGDPGDFLDRDFWAKGWQESLTAILAEPFKALCSSSASQSWQIVMGWNSVKGEKAAPPEAHSWRHNLASVAVHILLGKKKKKQSDTQVFRRVGMLRGLGWSGLELIKGIILSILCFYCLFPSPCQIRIIRISTSWSNSNLTFTVPWSCYFYILFIRSHDFPLFNSDCEQHSILRPSCLAFDTFPWIYSPHAKVVHSLL